MKVKVRVKNKAKLEYGFKEHCEQKLKKFDQYFRNPDEIEANILCKEYDDCKAIEVTIPTKNIILRAEVKEETFFNALDAAMAKLESQLRRHKSKIYSAMKRREGVSGYYAQQGELDLDGMQAELMASKLVKDKKIELTPMTVEDAILQMDMLDHDFYIFLNSETNKVCVVYLRNDNDYGIIEANI